MPLRRQALARAQVILVITAALQGCASSSKDAQLTTPADVAVDPSSLQIVGRLSRVWGMKPQRVDGVSLVVGLPGTGSDPPPTAEREMLLAEMQTREVDKPNSVLASSSTALVRVRGLIPAGARKGDHFDLFVEIPRETETTSIEGGWLMATRLREYAVLDNRVAEGHLLALGQGDVLTDALLESGDDEVCRTRGRVLGGGVVAKSRGFGLVVRDAFTSVQTSSKIGEAINRRFSVYHNGSKQGVANPKRDDFVELLVHPRYVGSEVRYIRVIQNIAVRESRQARSARLDLMRSQLADPSTAALAALQLEAIGEDGIPNLRDALDSTDLEIRFYAAEALAYQDVPDAVEPLHAAIRREPAFRWRALTALGAMDDVAAHEALVELLHAASAETRYGAFRILRRRTPDDPMIDGEVVNDSFSLHGISTTGPPLIHVSRVERPEIVFFDTDHELVEPIVVFAGKEIVVRSNQAGGVTVNRLSAGEEDTSVDCSRRVIDVIKTIAEVGGTYADVVHALTEARRTGCLKSRLEFSAIPTTGRTYRRGTTEADIRDDQLEPGELEPGELEPGDTALDRLAAKMDPSETIEVEPRPLESRSVAATVESSSTTISTRQLPGELPVSELSQGPAHATEGEPGPARQPRGDPGSTPTPAVQPETAQPIALRPAAEALRPAAEALRPAPQPLPPPIRSGALPIPPGEVAPLPPDVGPVLDFNDSFHPGTSPD